VPRGLPGCLLILHCTGHTVIRAKARTLGEGSQGRGEGSFEGVFGTFSADGPLTVLKFLRTPSAGNQEISFAGPGE
jgi:hypothetical protein